MPGLRDSFPDLLRALAALPVRGPEADAAEAFPAVVGVYLGRALDPRRAARARDALRDAGLLDPEALAGADPVEVGATLRAAGVAAPPKVVRPLPRLARALADLGPDWSRAPTERLRDALVAINGIGPATADALLLLGLGRPSYPLDRATYRVLVRHGWLDPTADPEEARSMVESAAGGDASALARLAAGLDRVGSQFCRAGSARCERCPLRPFLPEGGPLRPELE